MWRRGTGRCCARAPWVGNTQLTATGGQPDNAYASSAGPFNPNGLTCDYGGPPNLPYCLSSVQGISYPVDFYSVNQKLFSIYDGPAYQERNAYLDIPVTPVGKGAACVSNGMEQTCPAFKCLYGSEFGLPADPASNPANPSCYLPNAAIAWKQSNGFFYPPAFHSDNLFFQNVDIRHFVIEPLFNFGTFTTNPGAVMKRYCTWKTDMFANFTDVDRQTVLNDDDGSLTGLLADLGSGETRETISVNEDDFFNAPKMTPNGECASDIHDSGIPATSPPGTANTSPYEYITTATIAKCGINKAGCRQNLPVNLDCDTSNMNQYCAWGDQCTAGSGPTACYGVPLYRQYLTDQEYTKYSSNPSTYERPAIRMMGQATGQRSTLTVNHGKYYIDDQVTLQTQMNSGATEWNIYFPNQTYYTYFVYATSSMDQTYQMFVGYGLNKAMVIASVQPYRVILNDQDYIFNPATGASFLTVTYDDKPLPTGTGLVTVRVNLSAYAGEFNTDKPLFCQPRTYCAPKGDQCACAPGTECTDDSVCSWSVKDLDCPLNGCFAFGITMPANFMTGIAKPPVPGKFTDDPNYGTDWAVPWILAKQSTAGKQCTYTAPPD
jgi:hypothetical protein